MSHVVAVVYIITGSGQVPLSKLFQKSSDTWECPTCMISNKATDATCAACSCPKPTAGHDSPTVSVDFEIFDFISN